MFFWHNFHSSLSATLLYDTDDIPDSFHTFPAPELASGELQGTIMLRNQDLGTSNAHHHWGVTALSALRTEIENKLLKNKHLYYNF